MITVEKHNKKLLVEGNDDQHIIWALCKKENINEIFDVINCGGKDGLIKEEIPMRLKSSDVNTIGIIIDADTDLNEAWNLLRNKLIAEGFEVPKCLPESGLIIEGENDNLLKKVGVWIMPNNNLNGMLEDFIAFLVPQNDKLLDVVKSNLTEIEAERLNKYKPIHRTKAIIHSWLAMQEDPGTPLGTSITKKYLNNTYSPAYQKFIAWLKNLFE